MKILVVADHDGTQISDATARAVTAASQMKGAIHVLVAGHQVDVVAADAAGVQGVEKVLKADDGSLAHAVAEPVAALVARIAADYANIVFPATSAGKNIAPRVAATLDVMQISDAIAVHGADTFDRPIYAGNAVQTIRSKDDKRVVTIRPSAFAAAERDGRSEIEAVSVANAPALAQFKDKTVTKNERPELIGAKIVVSGGRGVGSEEKFKDVILPLADKLGGAVGASRAAVDSGFAPNDWQVGQTGKVVAPDLYIALGISGAIQHLAGMKDSKVIVAINKDGDAPIFQIADYGVVADMFEAVPQLLTELSKASD
jgi:electron transfer flavoprotein alpha subunit